jgi:hypothetical protein
VILTKFWVVRNAGPFSTLPDICFECTMRQFSDYMAGTGKPQFDAENHAIHTDEVSAKKDAEDRLKARDGLVVSTTDALRESGLFGRP